MKRLDRASGYVQTFDPSTFSKIEAETRQCVHCGFTWVYSPMDSFKTLIPEEQKRSIRGKCLKCYGLVCAQPHCLKNGCVSMLKQIDNMEKASRKLVFA